uniref:Uncharacterized protein n=1 Tax=Arundo donax TaxID=35708 RepID=A0A0A9HPN1_ARUDO
MGRRRLRRRSGGSQVPPERPHRRPPHHRSSCWPGPRRGAIASFAGLESEGRSVTWPLDSVQT